MAGKPMEVKIEVKICGGCEYKIWFSNKWQKYYAVCEYKEILRDLKV